MSDRRARPGAARRWFVGGALAGVAPTAALLAGAALLAALRPGRLRSVPGAVRWLLAAAALVAVPDLVRGQAPQLAAMLLLGSVVFWLGLTLEPDRRERDAAAWGAALGLALGALVGGWQLIALGAERALPWPWDPHPNLYAHATLAMAGAAVLVATSGAPRVAALAAGLVGIAVAGSRAALAALLGIAAVVPLRQRRGRRLAIAALLLLAVVATALPRIGTLLPALGTLLTGSAPAAPDNRFIGSEELAAPPWRSPGARAERLGSATPARWLLTREGGGRNAGVRQPTVLEATTTYTLSGVLQPGEEAASGFLGRRERDGTLIAELQVVLDPDGSVRTRTQGPLAIRAADARPAADGWWRLVVTFEVLAADPLPLALGPWIDADSVAPGARLSVRELQLEQGAAATAYRPGTRADWNRYAALRSVAERRQIWSLAWRSLRARPLLGWGDGAFSERYLATARSDDALRNPPTHAHNALLQLGFAWGAFGIAAFAIVVAVVAAALGRTRNLVGIAALAAILAANAFDVTLTYAGVLYPLLFASALQAPAPAGRGSDSRRAAP